jgi:hypothetical protein
LHFGQCLQGFPACLEKEKSAFCQLVGFACAGDLCVRVAGSVGAGSVPASSAASQLQVVMIAKALLGYPCAGVASTFHQSSVYHLIASGLRVGLPESYGDITGNMGKGKGSSVVADGADMGKGKGSSVVYQVLGSVFERGPLKGQRKRKVVSRRRGARGKARGKVAKLAVGSRAVGVGLDPALSRDLDLLAWLQPSIEVNFEQVPDVDKARARAAIAAAVVSACDLPSRIMAAARRAAAKQASKIWEFRGVRASRTSLEDAASDAVLGILQHVRRLDKVPAAAWSSVKLLRVLGLYGGRAAFRSLASWSVAGMSGDAAAFARRGGLVQALTTDLACEASLLASSLPDGSLSEGLTFRRKVDSPLYDESRQFPRRAFVRWVYDVGFRQFKAALPDGKGKGPAVKGARSRCRVVANVILGQSLADACALSGLASVKGWVQSCKASGFFESLKAARLKAVLDCQAVESARIAQRRFALQAAAAVKRLRYLNSSAWDSERLGVRGAGLSGSPAGLVAVRRLMDARAHCLTMAKHYKAIAQQAIADNVKAFDRVLDGLHSDRFGDLSQLFGITDRLGRRRGAGKVHASMIGKPKGKVSRKPMQAPTVALTVGKASRKLPCAIFAGGPVGMDGAQGFVIIGQPASR